MMGRTTKWMNFVEFNVNYDPRRDIQIFAEEHFLRLLFLDLNRIMSRTRLPEMRSRR